MTVEAAFYLGCTAPARSLNYEASARKVAEKLGIVLHDINDFTCCGFTTSFAKYGSYLAMAAFNLALAEEKGLDLATICNSCSATLSKAGYILREDPKLREEANAVLKRLGKTYQGKANVRHFVRLVYEDVGVEEIKKHVERPLEGIKIAPFYGCHYLKPSKYLQDFENPEDPRSLEDLIEAVGAEPVDHRGRIACCGGAILASDEQTSMDLAKTILDAAKEAGADAIILNCPFCSIMTDEYQGAIGEKHGTEYNIPVLYTTQMLGLAFGYGVKELGLRKNVVKTKHLVKRIMGEGA